MIFVGINFCKSYEQYIEVIFRWEVPLEVWRTVPFATNIYTFGSQRWRTKSKDFILENTKVINIHWQVCMGGRTKLHIIYYPSQIGNRCQNFVDKFCKKLIFQKFNYSFKGTKGV